MTPPTGPTTPSARRPAGPGRRWRLPAAGVVLCSVAAAAVVAGCADPERGSRTPPEMTTIGDPDRGAELISSYGCATCHVVPGVPGADGLVGPPLDRISLRTYLAGEITNSAENMQRWIRDPQAIEPGTAMPNLGVSESDSRDIAAFLYDRS